MGITGLLLLAFCLIGLAVFVLQSRAQGVERFAGSGQQAFCPTELINSRTMNQLVSSATGPPRWIWPVRLRVSRIVFNHFVALGPFFQTALLMATFEATVLNTVG